MRALIVEDEKLTAERLADLVQKEKPEIEIDHIATSVGSAREYLQNGSDPDLIFLDIELGDGTAFDLLEETKIDAPIIFTTAYDAYALKAFKFNSIDYLLKPIDPEELRTALSRWEEKSNRDSQKPDWEELRQMVLGNFKKRFLIKSGDKYKTIPIEEVVYFFSEDGYTFLLGRDGKKSIVDYTLDDLNEILDPTRFFRLNRKIIAPIEAIDSVASYFNGRLIVSVTPDFSEQIVISRERVKPFKNWLDG